MALKTFFRRCTVALAMTATVPVLCAGQSTPGHPGSASERTGPNTGITPPFTGEADSLSSLECVVVDQAGRAVSDASVQIRELGARALWLLGYTDSSGVVRFTQLPYGTYLVSVSSGISDTSDRINVDAMSGSITIVLRGSADTALNRSKQSTVSARQMAVPGPAKKQFAKASSVFEKRDYATARKHVDRALQLHPTYADALALRGVLNFIDGQTDLSVADLQLAIRYDPSLPMPHLALAGIYNSRDEYDAAGKMATQAMALAPLLWQGHYQAARASLGKGDYKSALREVQRAEELRAPRILAGITFVKARALAGIGDRAAAEMVLRAFLSQTKDASAVDGARRLLEALSRQPEAVATK